jgi:E1A/CREB-binding protein
MCIHAGDYWPGEAENQLTNIFEESRKDSKKGSSSKVTARNKNTKGKRYGTTCKDIDSRIMRNMAEAINHMREDFIVAHLQEPCSFCRKYISDENK